MKDAIKMMESKRNAESVRKANVLAEQEIMTIKLAQLREKSNIKQDEVKNFTQSSVSRLEKRKDIKISTLVEYLHGLGRGVEIKAYPKTRNTKVEEKILLKI